MNKMKTRLTGLGPKALLLFAGLLMAGSALIAGCTSEAPAASAEKAIKVGAVVAFTGPLATATSRMDSGFVAYMRYLNEEVGGIEVKTPAGKTEKIKLDLTWDEAQHDPSRTLMSYQRLAGAGYQVVYFNCGSCAVPNVKRYTEDKIPVFFNSPAPPGVALTRPTFGFGESSSYTDQMYGFMKWVKDTWKESRKPVVGVFQLETAMSRAELPGHLPGLAQELGVELLPFEWFPFVVTDASIQMARVKEKQPDWLILNHVPAVSVVMLKDAARLGMSNVKFVLPDWGFSQELYQLGPEVAEGTYGWVSTASPDEDVPGVRLAKGFMPKYYPDYPASPLTFKGTVSGMALVAALQNAVEKVGLENISGDAIREGFLAIKGVDTGGLTLPLAVKDPNYPLFNGYMKLLKLEKGKAAVVTDWIEGSRVHPKLHTQ